MTTAGDNREDEVQREASVAREDDVRREASVAGLLVAFLFMVLACIALVLGLNFAPILPLLLPAGSEVGQSAPE